MLKTGSQPAVVSVTCLNSDCYLYDCWPLAGRDEYWCFPLPCLYWLQEMFFQAGLSCFLLSDLLSYGSYGWYRPFMYMEPV